MRCRFHLPKNLWLGRHESPVTAAAEANRLLGAPQSGSAGKSGESLVDQPTRTKS